MQAGAGHMSRSASEIDADRSVIVNEGVASPPACGTRAGIEVGLVGVAARPSVVDRVDVGSGVAVAVRFTVEVSAGTGVETDEVAGGRAPPEEKQPVANNNTPRIDSRAHFLFIFVHLSWSSGGTPTALTVAHQEERFNPYFSVPAGRA